MDCPLNIFKKIEKTLVLIDPLLTSLNVFWIDMKYVLIKSFDYAISNGELSIQQERGIITLIPQKIKNRLLLKNWRPTSLLNTDYKLLVKIFATRLQIVLPDVINEDPSDYLRDHFTKENIRLVEDITFFTLKHKLPRIIPCNNFEKTFDSLNWNFLFKSLEKLNFGNVFINNIKTMHTNTETTVINNWLKQREILYTSKRSQT